MQSPSHTTSRRDVHAEITNEIIRALDASPPGTFVLPWRRDGQPLHLPVNVRTSKAYSGINVLALWVAAERHGFVHPLWATYRQWSERGAQVRKGERATTVIFYKEYDQTPRSDDPDDAGKRRVARASAVFNAAQVNGYAAPSAPPPASNGILERLSAADAFISHAGADIRFGGDLAYYDRSADFIAMPDLDRFTGTTTSTVTESFYATQLHELVHWTGASHRLNRQFGDRFGDAAYAAEELVAEIASAFLCSELQISHNLRPDHVQYASHWLQLLRRDKRAIFVAAARASEAARYLKSLHTGRAN